MANDVESFSWPKDWKEALPDVQRRVRSLCAGFGLTDADAEDIYQVASLRIWLATHKPKPKTEEIRDFPTKKRLVGWAGKVASNVLIKRWRAGSRLQRADAVDPTDLPARDAHDGGLEEYLGFFDDPVEREAVRLRFEEGCTYTEISERIGKSLGTSHTLVEGSLRKLRRRLKDGDHDFSAYQAS